MRVCFCFTLQLLSNAPFKKEEAAGQVQVSCRRSDFSRSLLCSVYDPLPGWTQSASLCLLSLNACWSQSCRVDLQPEERVDACRRIFLINHACFCAVKETKRPNTSMSCSILDCKDQIVSAAQRNECLHPWSSQLKPAEGQSLVMKPKKKNRVHPYAGSRSGGGLLGRGGYPECTFRSSDRNRWGWKTDESNDGGVGGEEGWNGAGGEKTDEWGDGKSRGRVQGKLKMTPPRRRRRRRRL